MELLKSRPLPAASFRLGEKGTMVAAPAMLLLPDIENLTAAKAFLVREVVSGPAHHFGHQVEAPGP